MTAAPVLSHLNPAGLPTNPAFSQGVSVEGLVRTVYVGGQNGAEGFAPADPADVRAQVERALRNVELVLTAAGARLDDVVIWSFFVVEGASLQEAFAAFQEVWGPSTHCALILDGPALTGQPSISKEQRMAQTGAEDITVNDVVAFLVEVAAILSLSAWGFHAGSGFVAKLVLGLGTPTVAIALWSLFAAPRSVFAMPAARLTVNVLVLGAAALASFTLLPVGWAIAFTILVVANTLLLYVGPFAR
ncbi:MAG TPA: DUF2568 domain-containing protein [Dermatophilaceae bacterium]